MTARWPRGILALTALVLAGILIAAIPPLRESTLRAAGGALIVDDPIEPADVIVIAADPSGGGVLEAADLFHRGIATRVAVFADPPDPVDREFLRRGIPYEDAAERSIRQLKSLGVTAVEQIPKTEPGTDAESQALADWCGQRHFRSIVVVSTPDHSRRSRRVLHRALKPHGTRLTVRPSQYTVFKPDRWWKTREGVRIEIIELEKLLFDVIRHPLS